jgi:hypothetical protein
VCVAGGQAGPSGVEDADEAAKKKIIPMVLTCSIYTHRKIYHVSKNLLYYMRKEKTSEDERDSRSADFAACTLSLTHSLSLF